MGKQIGKIRSICLLLLCIGLSVGCASGSGRKASQEEQTVIPGQAPETGQQIDEGSPNPEEAETDAQEEEFSKEKQLKENEDLFWDEADKQKISRQDGEKCLQVLLDDNIFHDGEMMLTGLRIADIDGNGQVDMLAMVLDAEEAPFYGSGRLWFYMNADEPYCFEEEDCSFYGWFDAFWADVDNDENIEIVFSAQGTGCGAVGDSYKAVFKYKDHAIEQMELPSDFEEDYDQGIRVELIQEPEPNSYSAYCPYLDEQIFFHGENSREDETLYEARCVGGNVRGYYDLRVAEYEGRKVLQASEYLSGEGGIAHGVASANFLITWEEDGTPGIIKWWIEAYDNSFANSHASRICYEDGYYYYASQMDHYFLYRAREDGSDPVCLARLHPGSICVQDGEIYFINQSDGNGIYRMKTDGTGMEKLCDRGQGLQISAEYIYFFSTYQAEYDKSGLVTEEPSEFEISFLYRMKKDGSGRELIAADVWDYALNDGYGSKVRYFGKIYYWGQIGEEWSIMQMDLDGKNKEKLCRLDDIDTMMVEGSSIYCIGDGKEDKKVVNQFQLWNGEVTSFSISGPDCCIYNGYTDYCIYNGCIYALDEQEEENGRRISIYRLNGEDCKMVYGVFIECTDIGSGPASDLYASEKGIFFRRYISEKEGCGWFRLIKDTETKEWEAEEWEDGEKIPGTLPAQYFDYGELRSVSLALQSTEGYEDYLADDLEYEEVHRMEERENPYEIKLPQFNSKIAGYQKINRYFQQAYQEVMEDKEAFFDMLDEEGYDATFNWFERTGYRYIYIGEKYITVEKYEEGYWGGIRSWIVEEPVTFDRQSGEVISLEKLLGMSKQEAVARLTGSVYKYKEGIGDRSGLLDEYDDLTKEFNPEQFFLFPEGIGIYYKIYAIGCGAEGDFLFIVPWEDFSRAA